MGEDSSLTNGGSGRGGVEIAGMESLRWAVRCGASHVRKDGDDEKYRGPHFCLCDVVCRFKLLYLRMAMFRQSCEMPLFVANAQQLMVAVASCRSFAS